MVILGFKGVLPVHVHYAWDIKVSPKIHFFLWLLAHRKNLTRDNLVKRQSVDDLTCLFCNELETCDHLFFGCAIATAIWSVVKKILKINVVVINFDVIAGLWKNGKHNAVANIVSAAVLWTIWLTRNDVFQSFFVACHVGVLEAVSLQPCSVDHSTSRGGKKARTADGYGAGSTYACSSIAVVAGARVTPMKEIKS
jgi:hypothetical protein